LPLITLPYLVRVLGPEKYGLTVFAQTFTTYFQILTDYGFNLSATREISINRENKKKISEIFSTVLVIKFFLFLISLLIMTAIVFSFKKFRGEWVIYYLSFGTVLGQTLFPQWLFLGTEKMKYITILNIIARLIFTVAIFVFVRNVSDYLYVPLLTSIGFIVAGILSIVIVFFKFKTGFILPTLKMVKHHIKEGRNLFLSQITATLSDNTNTFVLGLFMNNTTVAYYNAAEKLIRALSQLQTPFVTTMYPIMAKLVKKNINKAIIFSKKVLLVVSFCYTALIVISFIISKQIVTIIFGHGFESSAIVLRIMLVIPLIIFINNIYGTQFLINLKKNKEFLKVVVIGTILNILLSPFLTYLFGYVGAAISWLSAEISIMVGMYLSATKYVKQLKFKYIFNLKAENGNKNLP
jgi:PST family polysaccharide transporter